MFTTASTVDLSFREATASTGQPLVHHGFLLAFRDEQSQQTDKKAGLDLTLEYDIARLHKTNVFDSATGAALLSVVEDSKPVGVDIQPVMFLPQTDTIKILATDTLLIDPNVSGP